MIPKREKPIKDKRHLKYASSLPCCCCGRVSGPAHHLIGNYMGTPPRQGMKRGDNYTIPLCNDHHDKLHNNGNEIEFLAQYSVDGLSLAAKLWEESQCQKVK